MKKSIYIASVARCGTHYLKKIIAQTLGFEEDIGRLAMNKASFKEPYPHVVYVKEMLRPGGAVYTGHHGLHQLEELSDIVNIVYLVRDLRDVCVSAAYFQSNMLGLEYDEQALCIQRKRLLFYGCSNPNVINTYMAYRYNVRHELVRFADLIRNPVYCVSKLLFLFGYNINIEKLRLACQEWTYEKLSEGRPAGVENKRHHYRKGIVNDWKNYYTESQNRFFWRWHGTLMSAWGYEK